MTDLKQTSTDGIKTERGQTTEFGDLHLYTAPALLAPPTMAGSLQDNELLISHEFLDDSTDYIVFLHWNNSEMPAGVGFTQQASAVATFCSRKRFCCYATFCYFRVAACYIL